MDFYQILITGHIVGTAIGVGGATVADILFFKSIRDGKVSQDEYQILRVLSRVIMTGFIILIVSGLGFLALLFLNTGSLAGMPDRMLAKLYIVAIIFFNSRVLALKVLPLVKISIGKDIRPVLEKNSFLVITAGAVSIISWYSALLLGTWREIPFSLIEIMSLYFILLITVCSGANIIGLKRLRKFIYS
jgi:hypothetical protein